MRLPRPSFRLRTLMILVALAAVGMGGLVAIRRRERQFRRAAARHRFIHLVGFGPHRGFSGLTEDGRWVSLTPEQVEYHESLTAKYERAASRPWLPVAPDPPEPAARNEPNGVLGTPGKR